MTNLLNYNVGVYGGWAIIFLMTTFHVGRYILRGHRRAKRLKRMIEESEHNHHANLRILGEKEGEG